MHTYTAATYVDAPIERSTIVQLLGVVDIGVNPCKVHTATSLASHEQQKQQWPALPQVLLQHHLLLRRRHLQAALQLPFTASWLVAEAPLACSAPTVVQF